METNGKPSGQGRPATVASMLAALEKAILSDNRIPDDVSRNSIAMVHAMNRIAMSSRCKPVVGCDENDGPVTYGTHIRRIHQGIRSGQELTRSDLVNLRQSMECIQASMWRFAKMYMPS